MNQFISTDFGFKISVVMSVYQNDDAESFRCAVESVLNQTYLPSEIILVVDGLVSKEIKIILKEYAMNELFRIIRMPEKVGLGLALQKGCTEAQYPFIARMDSDDISDPTRFEKQIKYLQENPNCDVVGTFGVKFFNSFENVYDEKKLPITDQEIKRTMQKRNPLNHMSIMMKKESLLKCGNYQDWYLAEDYYLWVRMCLNGVIFHNIPENLVSIRVDNRTLARRHGIKYYKSLKRLYKFMLTNKIISCWRYLKNILTRFVYHVLIPKWLKKLVYRKF